MARPLRIEFTGAICHMMSRGNARQRIFRDDRDYERLLEGLKQTVTRCGWELFSFGGHNRGQEALIRSTKSPAPLSAAQLRSKTRAIGP